MERSCFDFWFIDERGEEKLIVHGFDMLESLRLGNNGCRLQAYKYHLNDTWYVINWDNVSFACERICSDDPSCPVWLARVTKAREEEERIRKTSEKNFERSVKRVSPKKDNSDGI